MAHFWASLLQEPSTPISYCSCLWFCSLLVQRGLSTSLDDLITSSLFRIHSMLVSKHSFPEYLSHIIGWLIIRVGQSTWMVQPATFTDNLRLKSSSVVHSMRVTQPAISIRQKRCSCRQGYSLLQNQPRCWIHTAVQNLLERDAVSVLQCMITIVSPCLSPISAYLDSNRACISVSKTCGANLDAPIHRNLYNWDENGSGFDQGTVSIAPLNRMSIWLLMSSFPSSTSPRPPHRCCVLRSECGLQKGR